MLLRTSVSNTKKFFNKTLEGFKSFLSGGYRRLPKSPPCGSFPCNGGGGGMEMKYTQSYQELDKWNADYSNPWNDIDPTEKASKKKDKSAAVSRCADQFADNMKKHVKANPVKSYEVDKKEERKKRKNVYKGKRFQELSISKVVREERSFMVAKKLKELEMLDKSNVEHVLDIEEVLHYYSRLTCPAYLDVVDKFVMEMYTELLSGQQASSRINHSGPKLRTIGF